jgi:hypothetical protein
VGNGPYPKHYFSYNAGARNGSPVSTVTGVWLVISDYEVAVWWDSYLVDRWLEGFVMWPGLLYPRPVYIDGITLGVDGLARESNYSFYEVRYRVVAGDGYGGRGGEYYDVAAVDGSKVYA